MNSKILKSLTYTEGDRWSLPLKKSFFLYSIPWRIGIFGVYINRAVLFQEELTRGKPNYEHLDDELHVLIQCEDTRERAIIKLNDATNHIKKLLVPPAAKGIDELKRKQLMELAIINGTYRPNPQSRFILIVLSGIHLFYVCF